MNTQDASGPDRLRGRILAVASISWPLLAGSLTSLLVAVADTAILGHVDTGELATMARASVVYVFCTALLIPMGTAVQIVGAQWFGASDLPRVMTLLRRARWLALLCGSLMAVALLAGAPWILTVTTGPAAATAQQATVTVLRVLALGVPFVALSSVVRGWLGAQGLTKVALGYALVVNLSNVALDVVLVFGLGWGAQGSAWGTTAASLLGLITCLAIAARRRRALPAADVTTAPTLRPLGAVAWPDVIFGAATYGGDILIVAAVATMGATQLAGYRIVSSTTAVLFTIAFTCGSGVAILVGQRLGAGEFRRGLAYARAGAIVMAACVGLAAMPVLVLPSAYLRLYTSDPGVTQVTGPALLAFWAIAPLIVAAIAMAAVVRAVGNTRSMMYIGLATQLVVSTPAAWLLGVALDGGLAGVTTALALGWATRTWLTLWRLRRTSARLLADEQADDPGRAGAAGPAHRM